MARNSGAGHCADQWASEGKVMSARLKWTGASLGLIGGALVAVPDYASAISVEVAKKCNALIAKEFPPREPGNPAAGSAKGSGRDQRAFFSRCVANNGSMEDKPAK
jgi:hypothetical protein